MKFLTITDLGTIEFVNDLNYIVSAGISARDVYSTFRAERRAVVTPEPRAPWRRVPTGSARGEHCVTPARAAEKETRGAPGWGGGGSLRILSDRDDRRIFWGLKFSISGFFGGRGVGKFWQVSGAHHLQVLTSSYFFRVFHALWKYFMARKLVTGYFWG